MTHKRPLLSIWFFLLAVLFASCATSVNSDLQTGYNAVNAYVSVTRQSLARGRITPDQAAQASEKAKQAKAVLDQAAHALSLCDGARSVATACADYQGLMTQAQPMLVELERALKE